MVVEFRLIGRTWDNETSNCSVDHLERLGAQSPWPRRDNIETSRGNADGHQQSYEEDLAVHRLHAVRVRMPNPTRLLSPAC
jgi:hypothetical protein